MYKQLLLTKKVIYNAVKEAKRPHILTIKKETKKFYYQEKHRFCMKGQSHIFEIIINTNNNKMIHVCTSLHFILYTI